MDRTHLTDNETRLFQRLESRAKQAASDPDDDNLRNLATAVRELIDIVQDHRERLNSADDDE